MRSIILAAVVILAFGCFISVVEAQDFRTVAITGTPASGINNDSIFSSIGFNPILNDRGEVAFRGGLARSGEKTIDSGIWLDREGDGPELVAGIGDPNSGKDTAFFYIGSFAFNNNGKILFDGLAQVNNPDRSFINGLWSGETGNEFELIFQEGMEAPGAPSTSFSNFGGWPTRSPGGSRSDKKLLRKVCPANNLSPLGSRFPLRSPTIRRCPNDVSSPTELTPTLSRSKSN